MVRIRNFYFKLLLVLLVLCTFCIYLIKFRFASNEFEQKSLLLIEHLKIEKQLMDKAKNRSIKIFSSFNKNMSSSSFELSKEIDLAELSNEKSQLRSLIEKREPSVHKTELGSRRAIKNSKNDKYVILEYTNVFYKPKFCDKSSENIFNSVLEKCEFSNCEYTCDKAAHLNNADALLFHQRDLETELKANYGNDLDEWLKNTKQIPYKTAEEKVALNPNQVWILWDDEATRVDTKFNKISNLFNWTLSYKTESEIFEGSYGFFKPNKDLSVKNLRMLREEIYVENFIKRNDAILWFVSNCDAKVRSKIALEISKHYPLFIYGKCDLVAGMSDSELKLTYPYLKVVNLKAMNQQCGTGSECEENKFRSFKYYLAFENTNCSDYVTEKIWKSLNKNMIPIVLQPNRDSYIRYSIPSESFIHLQDFDFNVEKLTNHLHHVDRNFTLYYDYLKWTFVYLKTYYNSSYTEPHRMCQLCKKLNTFEANVYYKKIADFFNYQCKF